MATTLFLQGSAVASSGRKQQSARLPGRSARQAFSSNATASSVLGSSGSSSLVGSADRVACRSARSTSGSSSGGGRRRRGPTPLGVTARAAAAPARDLTAPLSLAKNAFPDIELAQWDAPAAAAAGAPQFDLVVVGSGPSGLAVADRVSAAGFKVLIVDPNPLAPWVNNFGVWCDEFEAMGLEDCFDVVWPKALVYLDESSRGERFLKRPYARVDRPKLKRKLLERCRSQGVLFHCAKVSDVAHGGGRSVVTCADGSAPAGSLVLDATGHSRRLVRYARFFNPGYQGAYGVVVEVESHPFDCDTMLFMDWRDTHLDSQPDVKARNAKLPTFLYAMPFSPTKVFLEETSLVARPIIPFPELKLRLEARMKHLGIKVVSMEEEEFCAIPMGGCLPQIPQRVLGIGGTAGMVHPSTGYMMSRVMGAAPTLADAIVEQLCSPADKAAEAGTARAPRDEAEADAMAAAVWAAMWPAQRVRQREFFQFGMEVLLKLDLAETREFFDAFFSLSDFHWHGFLSSRLSFPQLIGFGLSLFAKSSNAARLNLLQKGLPGLVVMLARLAATLRK